MPRVRYGLGMLSVLCAVYRN